MKLRILILSIFGTFVFNSCSSDSNSSNQNTDPNSNLPKKVIFESSADHNVYELFYNQNKIDYVKISTDGTNLGLFMTCYFTYNGDLISNICHKDSSGNIIYNENFIYQNNKLVKYIGTNTPLTNEVNNDYVYNNDGTIDCIYSDTTNGIGGTVNYTYINGMVTKMFNGDITYFPTNSPFKNIKGIDECYFTHNTQDGFFLNQLFISTTLNVNSYDNDFHYSYVYNDNLYPSLITKISNFGFNQGTFNITYY